MNGTSLVLYAALSAPLLLAAACGGNVTVAANGGDGGGTVSTDAGGGGTVFTDGGRGSFSVDGGSWTPSVDGGGSTDASDGGADDAGGGTGSAPDGGSLCSTLPGDALVLASAQAACDSFAGRWLICEGRGKAIFPPDVVGVEFGPAAPEQTAAGGTVGGTLYLLIPGPSGPVRGSGYTYTYAYDVSGEPPSSYQLNIHPAPNSGFGGGFKVSASPRWITMNNDFDPFTISFVGI